MSEEIWIWQRILSPHMIGLAMGLAVQGARVTFIAERLMSPDRASQGWQVPKTGTVDVRLTPDVDAVMQQVADAHSGSIHVCQGIRANGLVGAAQLALARRRLRQWVVMETVDDDGGYGILKRMEYRRQFFTWRNRLEGVLAIGHTTSAWVIARGMGASRVFPFAYFLPEHDICHATAFSAEGPFRVLFVGQFIECKRLDLLIRALKSLGDLPYEVEIIGSGPLEASWREIAEDALGRKVKWLGRRAQIEVPSRMAAADCLVLPSRHDGWGAVVSEALMVGTPVLCSDRCGAAGVVRASGCGGVFATGDSVALAELLNAAIAMGRQTTDRRQALASWARCLGAIAGAKYLSAILQHSMGGGPRPMPPWASTGTGAATPEP